MRKIYITGCARSGTTLLARLFHAFDSVQVINDEISLINFDALDVSDMEAKYLVGKRTEFTLFGNTLSENNQIKHAEIMTDMIIINCIRDGRHVVDSWVNAWGMYDPFAWMNSIDQSIKYKGLISLNVKYEDLINDPDSVQVSISEKIGLNIRHKFSRYPEFVPSYSFQSTNEKYTLAQIEKRSKEIPNTYLRRPNDVDYFNNLLTVLGYVRD